MKASPAASSIDEYIAAFPPGVQARLKQLRATIREIAPDATERISYGMPTFFLEGNLVHFAGYANHIGLYPTPSAVTRFEPKLRKYRTAKGSIQFPHDEPLPLALVSEIVRFRVKEQTSKSVGKKR